MLGKAIGAAAIVTILFLQQGLISRSREKLQATENEATRLRIELLQVSSKAARKTEEDVAVKTQTLRMMALVGFKGSAAYREILADLVVDSSRKVFGDDVENRLRFVIMVGIESAYERGAKSPVGAAGLTQIIPKWAQEFSDRCSLGKLASEDLWSDAVNLRVGACQFRYLLAEASIPDEAFLAYNRGKNSPDMLKIKRLGQINRESADYLVRANTAERYLNLEASSLETRRILEH